MRKHLFLIVAFAFSSYFLNSQVESLATAAPDSKLRQKAFKEGEFLEYRIHYGIINAGRAELRVKNLEFRAGRPVFHVVGTGRTVGMAEVFFRTRDKYESWIDADSLVPHEFIRDVDEGGYIIKRHLHFDHAQQKVKDNLHKVDTVFDIPKNVQDMLSAFYYARTIDGSNLKKGDLIPISVFLDHEVFTFQLKFLGKDKVKSKFGKINCLKFMPYVQSGRVFKEKEGITLWVSDDESKVPIRMEAELAVGSIKMDLSNYKNVHPPLKFK